MWRYRTGFEVIMTTLEVKIDLPDELAQRAKDAGLLTNEAIEALLREALRKQAGEDLRTMIDKLSSDGAAPMNEEEIQAEIDAYRAERRATRR
jgi:post-segregation antitoxin (ccd killing protein)